MVTTVQEFDLIQRIRVEDGVPRVISTTIQVIEGGEDLLSFAREILKTLKFEEKYIENIKSQYIGYKLKNPKKGYSRYQLIFFNRENQLSIAVPKNIVEPFLLKLQQVEYNQYDQLERSFCFWWLRPLFIAQFFEIIEKYGYEPSPKNDLSYIRKDYDGYKITECYEQITNGGYAISASIGISSSLFPYTWQFRIESRDVLAEFLNFFAVKLMEL
jgi:hypothetical protein